MQSKPQAYLVKEIQRVATFVTLNRMHMKKGMGLSAQYDFFFNVYHGSVGSPNRDDLPFIRQVVEGLSHFQYLFCLDNVPVMARLTGSPYRRVRFRLHPLLVPGADKPIYVGTRPTADIQLEHLELNSLSGKTKALISVHTLHRYGAIIQELLQKVEPILAECLTSSRDLPSRTNLEDLFRKLTDKIAELQRKGTL